MLLCSFMIYLELGFAVLRTLWLLSFALVFKLADKPKQGFTEYGRMKWYRWARFSKGILA